MYVAMVLTWCSDLSVVNWQCPHLGTSAIRGSTRHFDMAVVEKFRSFLMSQRYSNVHGVRFIDSGISAPLSSVVLHCVGFGMTAFMESGQEPVLR